MSLNELEQGMNKSLCPTDSRFRPDIRKLEQGDIDGAAIEKTRLEEKQRDASKQRKSKKTSDWAPRYITFFCTSFELCKMFILFCLDGFNKASILTTSKKIGYTLEITGSVSMPKIWIYFEKKVNSSLLVF